MLHKGSAHGLHFRKEYPQAKLACSKRLIFDGLRLNMIQKDIRQSGSEQSLQSDNKKQSFIRKALHTDFLVYSDVAEFCYKATDFWHLEMSSGLHGMILQSASSGHSLSESIREALTEADTHLRMAHQST